jgi:hypothetical protein
VTNQLNRALAEHLGYTVVWMAGGYRMISPDRMAGAKYPTVEACRAHGSPSFCSDPEANKQAWDTVLNDERWLEIAPRLGHPAALPDCQVERRGGYWYAAIGPKINPYASSESTSDAVEEEYEARALCLLTAFAVLTEPICPTCRGEHTVTCAMCAGSGEGQRDGALCGQCGAQGEMPCPDCCPSPDPDDYDCPDDY